MAQRHRTIAVLFTVCALAALTACGGGGGGGSAGGGTPSPSGGGSSGTRMGGAIQGTPLPLSSTISTVSTLAGTAVSADGTGATANFNGSQGIVWVSSTLAFVADGYSYTVRKIDTSTGTTVVTTVAGLTGAKGNADAATGTAARFGFMGGITTDGTNLYIADTGNCTIRRIAPATGYTLATMTASTAAVSTLAGASTGCGELDNTGTTAQFNAPTGITTDRTNLYVSDAMGQTVRKIAPSTGTLASMSSANAVVTTLAGTAGTPGSTDATGTAARFNNPSALTTDSFNLYVADTNNHEIRVIAPSGVLLANMTSANAVVTTLAGSTNVIGNADNTGTSASFNAPTGISTDNSALYISDANGQVIRKIAPSGGSLAAMTSTTAVVTTLAGTAATTGSADGTGTAASFRYPYGIAAAAGISSLLVADTYNHTVRRIAPLGGTLITMTSANAAVSTLASTAVGTDGTGAAARFGRSDNSAYTTDGTYLYVADAADNTIRRVTIATGVVITLAGAPGQTGTTDGTGNMARFDGPRGITTDGNAIFVADSASDTIRKIAPVTGYTMTTMTSATASVITVAGTAGSSGSNDGGGTGTTTAALFHSPEGLTTDGVNLYVSDTLNHKIRKIAAAGVPLAAMTNLTAVVTTLAGTGSTGTADGTGTAAAFNAPNGLTTDGVALYVDDTGNNKIRKILPAGGTLAAMTNANAAVTTLAGSTAGHVDGSGATALFNMPTGITTDGSTLYITDYASDTVRTIKPGSGALSAITMATATVGTLSGQVNVTAVLDGNVQSAEFWNPSGITTDGSRLLLGDANGGTVRAIH